MNDSIRKFKNNDELIKDLEQRNLIFSNSRSKEIFNLYLKSYGYFSFIKNLSHDLMYSDINKKIYKTEFTSDNLRYLFDIDRNISVIIFKFFRNIEFQLNNAILKVIAKRINKNAKCPYLAALDNEGFEDIFPNIYASIPKFKNYNQNVFANFFDDVYKNIKNFDYDSFDIINKNKQNETNEIKELIKKGWFKQFMDREVKKKWPNWEFLDIFSLFQTITFSQLIRLFSYLSISLRNEVVKEFFNYFKPKNKYLKLDHEEFSILIHILSNLRNVLMHNGSIIRFSCEIKEEVKLKFEKFFDIKIKSNKIQLFEVISIIELIIDFKDGMFNEINKEIQNKMNNRKSQDKISKLIFDIILDYSGIDINVKY